MAREHDTKRYEDWYAKLLRLYPKSYQRRFAEPMQQMFADMCREHGQSGESMVGFLYKVYADTAWGIVKECVKGVTMSTKTSKNRMYITAGSVSLLLIIGTVAFWFNNRQPSVIAPMSSFAQAQESSKGKKKACLTDNAKAISAVKADDKYLDDAKEFSMFEMTASSGMRDVPAGTNYETTINTYNEGLVTGAVTYEKDYGKYNYTIKKLPAAGEWEFVSMVACQ